MKESEYGGRDTEKTQGIQTDPHVLTASEQLRLIAATDPADQASQPDALQPKYNG